MAHSRPPARAMNKMPFEPPLLVHEVG